MADAEKRMERHKKHRNGTENAEKRRKKPDRMPLLHKQPAKRAGNNEQSCERTLEHRKYALAFGRDIPGRRKYNNRQNGGAEPEYYQEMVFEYIKNGGIINKNQTPVHEKETLCYQFTAS